MQDMTESAVPRVFVGKCDARLIKTSGGDETPGRCWDGAFDSTVIVGNCAHR